MPKEPYREEEVAKGLWWIAGAHGWGSGVSAAVVTTDKHAVVIDTLYRPVEARRMFKRIRSWKVKPIALVNTHWHTDHTVGNSLFRCPIWSQTRGPRLLRKCWPSWVGPPSDRRAGGLRLKSPNRLFVRRASINLDGEEIELIHLPGHTPDSAGVFLPERRILVAGDAVMDLPFVWFGNSLDSIRSLRLIQKLSPRVIIQGHGRPCTASRLESDIRYLEKVRAAIASARRSGLSRKEALNGPLEEYVSPSRLRSLGEGYRGAHQANLERVWLESR